MDHMSSSCSPRQTRWRRKEENERIKMSITAALPKKSKGRNAPRTSASLPSMTVIGSAKPNVLLIKVYKLNDNDEGSGYEYGTSKKLCIDPSLASYRSLQSLIAQAFDLKADFTINAVEKCPATGLEKSTAIWSDWDLESAVRKVEPGSYLRLCYELTAREDGLDDWDLVPSNDFTSNIRCVKVDNRSIIATVKPIEPKKPSALKKTINIICGANDRRTPKPLGLDDMCRFLDDEGRLRHPHDLRLAIYEGGIDHAARNIIWRYLLNIFRMDMTNTERDKYLENAAKRYAELKRRWRLVKRPNEKVRAIMRAIRTDVVRTDRTFEFYTAANNGTNANIETLYDILVTFAISHPSIPYFQGMNEYASTLLYVMRDESLAYLSFCSIMRRIRANFSTNGVAIATKFHHLTVLLKAYDPNYWHLLETCDAVNLYFTYRWLLLECKREFPFKESLRVLEVMWATLPIEDEPPELCENDLLPVSPDSSSSHLHADALAATALGCPPRRTCSCPCLFLTETSTSRPARPYSHSVTSESILSALKSRATSIHHDFYSTYASDEQQQFNTSIKYDPNVYSLASKSKSKGFENSYSLSEISELDSDLLSPNPISKVNSNPFSSSQHCSSLDWLLRLPTDSQISIQDDNSFLLFLCIAILSAHRHHLLKRKNLDQQEIAIHFDQHRRRHPSEKLLVVARNLYEQYIQFARRQRMLEDLNIFSVS